MTSCEKKNFFSDMKIDGLWARLPTPVLPYIHLARLDRPIGIWLLLLPGWWAIMQATGGLRAVGLHDFFMMALFGAGAIIMRAAGCIINDLWDIKFDRAVARTNTRPLAAGKISPQQALIFLLALLCMGFMILMQLPLVSVLLGFLTIPLIILYPLMKRITWWPQLFLGIVFNFGALMGWAAVTGILEPPALLLYAGGIFWTLGYDTIYAHQDKEDDARIGIKSTALKLGPKSPYWVAAFYALSLFLIFLAFAAAHAGALSLILLSAPAAHLFRQLRRWDMNDPASSLSIFRSNRDFGLLVLAAACL